MENRVYFLEYNNGEIARSKNSIYKLTVRWSFNLNFTSLYKNQYIEININE